MKPSLPILVLLAAIATTTEATDAAAIIKLKSRIGDYVLNTVTSAIQAKQNLVRSSTAAIINAQTNFLQRQLPHFVNFKTNQINSVLELKKNLIKSKAAQIGQLAGGNAIQAAEQDVAPYSSPAVPPAPVKEPQTEYSPLQQLEPLPPAALPAAVPIGPYPPPSYIARRQLTTQKLSANNEQASSHFQRTPSREVHHSVQPTPPPQPPVRTVRYV